jgi:hypothetical protein
MNQAVSRKPETAKTNGRLNSADSAFWHNRISLFRIYLAKLTATELGIHVTVIMEAGYAFDATVIDLCLSLFPWAHSRSTKAAIKLNPLLDLRGPQCHAVREGPWPRAICAIFK